ncbi:protein of unknown function [Thauera humireducens]|nr:protein of unknown function [Thauera humireducens]
MPLFVVFSCSLSRQDSASERGADPVLESRSSFTAFTLARQVRVRFRVCCPAGGNRFYLTSQDRLNGAEPG